jgi:micrococcal nuclease
VLTRIVDGDTVECDPVGRIRLIGMDSPELAQAPFGAQASQALARLAPVGSRLEVEYDVERRDPYGRVLGHLWHPGRQDPLLLNWALVREGYALLLTIPPNVKYVEALAKAQEAAREDRAGLWAVDGFACEPADFRAGRCGPRRGDR